MRVLMMTGSTTGTVVDVPETHARCLIATGAGAVAPDDAPPVITDRPLVTPPSSPPVTRATRSPVPARGR